MPWPNDQLLSQAQSTHAYWPTLGNVPGLPAISVCHLSSPLLPFQIIKAYLDYSLHHQLAGYEGVWFKYEIMAMEQIFNLPLKGEGIEIVTHVADKLSYTKLLMGHLDLAIDLGKAGWARRDMQVPSHALRYPGIAFFPGFRAHKMWALLRNPNRQYMVLCWLSKSLFLKNRYLAESVFQSQREEAIGIVHSGSPLAWPQAGKGAGFTVGCER